MWKDFPQYDASNTLLVDDAEAKCAKNPPRCCLVTGDISEVEARVVRPRSKKEISIEYDENDGVWRAWLENPF